jgi:pimeloyl-ACP methyl ester carboxylesterase
MLRATVPWLVRRDDVGARRLARLMSGPGRPPAADLVEWLAVVARACRTTGAPDPLPEARLLRWRDHRVGIAVGRHDVFFPVARVSAVCRTTLGREVLVVPDAGHLLVDEEPEVAARVVAGVLGS